MGRFFIQNEKELLYLGLINNGKLQRLFKISESEGIYISIIERKMPNYNGYIISLEDGKKGLLDEKQVLGKVKPGDEVIVGLYKKTQGTKLDKYTMNYGIPGKYIVYYPNKKRINFSKKLSNEDKNELYNKALESEIYNVVFRSNAGSIDFLDIKKEYESLKNVNKKIIEESKFLPIPRKLFVSYKNLYSTLQGVKEPIYVNDKDIEKYLKKYLPNKDIRFDKYYKFTHDQSIEEDLVNLQRKVLPLPNNGNIIIEKTEALTVIDVNGKENSDFLKLNMDAISESIRAMEVLDLQGIVIIDCITLKKSEYTELLKYINNILKGYEKIKFHGITKLGLLEFTKTGLTIDI
ncbi:MAG: ribonuclease E/G [Lagierella massiliensis]|nr:ribonuclease E/G [Lagierella massiliensis]